MTVASVKADGENEGDGVGAVDDVGERDGHTDGWTVGTALFSLLGTPEGIMDRSSLGGEVGTIVGRNDGDDVGS